MAIVDWISQFLAPELAILAEHDVFARLGIATFCGALLGLEREYAEKPAGLRTNIFICAGSALFTLGSIVAWQMYTGGAAPADPMRVAAQIVTGVGFLGAGVILKTGEQITGITTAATIWFVAAIGMVIGIGLVYLGLIVSLFATCLLFALGRVERVFPSKRTEDEK